MTLDPASSLARLPGFVRLPGFIRLQRRIGRFPIEIPAAAVMAFAVALVTVALPAWRFEAAVAATGLPGLISAAQPPLGQTARVLTALVLGGLAFAAVRWALRALDREPVPTDFPAFRAADLHPDAPRRRPILAGSEFGAPAEDEAVEPHKRRRPLVSEPLPSFLAPQPAEIGDFVPEIARDAEYVEIASETSEPTAPVQAPEPTIVEPPLLRSKPHAAPVIAPAPVSIVPTFLQPEIIPPRASAVEQEYNDAEDEESVSSLMARLESGLSRGGGRPKAGLSDAAQEDLSRTFGDLDRSARRAR